MMTYTEEQVRDLINENIALKNELGHLSDKLRETEKGKEQAEEKYHNICERCIHLYLQKSPFDDTISVKVKAPRFMSDADFETGVVRTIVAMLAAKRKGNQYFY